MLITLIGRIFIGKLCLYPWLIKSIWISFVYNLEWLNLKEMINTISKIITLMNLSIFLSVFLCILIYLFINLSFRLFVYLYIHLFIYLGMRLVYYKMPITCLLENPYQPSSWERIISHKYQMTFSGIFYNTIRSFYRIKKPLLSYDLLLKQENISDL